MCAFFFSPDSNYDSAAIKNTFRYQENVLIYKKVLLDSSLTVKATTLIFMSGPGSAISSAKQGKSGFIYNLVKS